jgi:hypothetical protein
MHAIQLNGEPTSSPARRRCCRIATLATILLFAATVSQARADGPPSIKLTETVVIDSVGDGQFSLDVKMPAAMYTVVKINNPNTALMLRRLGLHGHQWMELQDIRGTFEDGTSTVKIQWTARGLARMGRDQLWEVPLWESKEIDVVSLEGNKAIFTGAAETPLGLAVMTVKGTLPEGARDLQILKTPARLGYRLPPPQHGAGNSAALDFTWYAKPQVMTALARAHGNPRFSKMWVARTVVKNTGQQTLQDYGVRFRIADFTSTWSPWQKCAQVVPGQTVVDAYFPIFDLDKVNKMTSSRRAVLEVEYQYRKSDGSEVKESVSKTVELLGRHEVYYSSLPADERVGFHDQCDYGPAILASFVSRDDPIMQQVAGWVSGQSGGAAGGGAASITDEAALKFLQSLYEFMANNKIAYQTPPVGTVNGQLSQHIKYGRDVLQNKAGTCIDLAIFYGSVCEAVGLRPVLFLVPGHCFPGAYLPKSGRLCAVETTLVGRATFAQAVRRGLEEVAEADKNGQYFAARIAVLREAGIHGLELPALPPSTLRDLGIGIAEQRRPVNIEGMWNGDCGQYRLDRNGQVVHNCRGTLIYGKWDIHGNAVSIEIGGRTMISGVVNAEGNRIDATAWNFNQGTRGPLTLRR